MAKNTKGASKRGASAIPLKERLLAKGVYTKPDDKHNEPPPPPSHLFSPLKPARKPSKISDTSKKGPSKAQRAVMQSYFRRKSTEETLAATSQSNQKRQDDALSFMLDTTEMEKVKHSSEAFLSSLAEQETDCSEVVVVDTSSIDQLANERGCITEDNVTNVPLAYNPRGVAYSMLKLGPRSQFGPLMNTAGMMVIIFIDVSGGKVFYESLNLTAKRRIACPRQSHVLILPDDVFKLYNDSDSADASVLLLSCRKDGKDFNLVQHVQGAHKTPVKGS